MLSDGLTSYVTRLDVRAAMHPEVQAEITFGLDNSLGVSSVDMTEQLRVFAEHTAEWRDVDVDIVGERDKLDRVDPPGSVELQAAAGHEVAAWEAIWQGEWERALDLVRRVLDALRGGQAPQRYAALWSYLASCLALRLADQTGDTSLRAASTTYYAAARAAGRGTTWLSHLAAPAERNTSPTPPVIDPVDESAMTAVLAELSRLGRPGTFEPEIANARSGLLGVDPRPYEQGLVLLGRLAGAAPSEGDGGADAAPDATWIFGQTMWILWETKSDAEPSGELGANDVRQAGSHLRFVEHQRSESSPGDSASFVMTPQLRVHPAARSVAEDHVYLVSPVIVVDLFDRIVRAWRNLRARNSADLTRTDALATFTAEGAAPSQWLPRLRERPLRARHDERP